MMLLTALLTATTSQAAMTQDDSRTLTVHDGNTTNKSIPAHIYYFDYFTRSQFVIPASELGAMAGGTISSLTFYTTDNKVPCKTDCSVDVYLMEVGYTTMTAFEPKEFGTIVYQGTLSIVEAGDGGTMTITFTEPYTYSGGGNLLIGIENTAKGVYLDIYFYGQKVAAAARSGYDEGSLAAVNGSQVGFIPKTTFTYTPGSGPVYYMPTSLALADADATTATLSWAAPSTDVTDYAYQYRPTGTEAWSTEARVTTTTATLSGLTAATAYDFRVKAIYSDDDESRYATLRFTTTAIASVAVGDSWSDDFEGDACSWQLLNGDLANAWIWGIATHSGGTHALYISNDGGTNNAYVTGSNHAMVYAAKPFTFTDGKYEFTYDWRCYGEGNCDFLRVALVPTTETLEASTSAPSGFGHSSLPTGWIAVDGGGQLNLTQNWHSKSAAISNLAAGKYYLVFAWRNDGYSGSQPPAAVDNVSIRRVGCAADVDDLTVSYTGGTTATLSWAAGEATQWQVAYSTSSNFAQATEAIVDLNPNLSVQTYTLTDLPIGNTCYARVRSYCGGTDYGVWSETVSFETTDKYVIGTGTQTSTSLPTNSHYNYSRTQQLYTAAELGAAGTIMSIDFKNASSEACTRRIEIYMVGTAKSSFVSGDDWVGTTADDLVFSGEVTFAAGQWTTITLDTPFEYNGQGNVVIAVNDSTGSYTYKDTKFLTFSATHQALYAHSNGIIADDNSGNIGDNKNQLRLGKGEQSAVARPSALTVSYNGGTTATLSWTESGTATEWEICLNGDEANLVSVGTAQCTVDNGQWTMELTGLSYATIYQVKVRARQDGGVSYWSLPTRFNTELCPPEDLCNIALALTDSRGDGWKGNAIKVVDKQSGIVIGTYANTAEAGANEPQTCLVAVPNGRDIQFVWVKGTSTAECSFSIYDVNDELICKFDKNDQGPAAGLIATYTVDCSYSPWRTPVALTAVQDIPTTATLSWTERGEATAWVVAYKADGDEDFAEVVVNQNENQNVITYTLTGLAGLTQYTVKVRPDSGEGGVVKWSEPITFTTIDANPVPTNVTATAGTRKATLSWTAYGNSYNVRYRPADHFSSSLFTEGFEGGIDNWILRDCDRRTAISNTKVHAGNQAFMFDSKDNQYLISPELTDIAEGTLMEFYYSNSYNDEDQNLVTFQVGFSSTTNATDAFDFGTTITTYDAQWHLYSVAVPAGTKYICWKVLSTGTWMFFIDDIKIGKETAFTSLSTPTTTATLTGLTLETTYEYQVQSVKDEAASAWTELATFTTLPLISIELADDGTANATTLSTCDGEEDVTVTLSGRTIYADGTWQALCLPFALNTLNGTPLDGFTVKELDTEGKWEKINEQWTTSSNGHQTGIDNDGKVYLHFKDATSIEAGKPYFVSKLVMDEGGTQPTYQATEGTAGSTTSQEFTNLIDGWGAGYTWRTSGLPSYCMFEASKPVYVTGYTLTTSNQRVDGDPTVWTLEARISESDEWTVIDSRNTIDNNGDALPSGRTANKNYTIQQPGVYMFFRFTVKETIGNTFMCLTELALHGTPVVEGDVVNPVFTGVTINATAPATVSSLDAQVSITGSYDAVAANGKGRSLFFPGSGSRLYNAQAGTTLGACRAFFNIGDGSMQPTLGGSNCLQGIVVPNLLPGDANSDGYVTIDDVIAVVNYILGNTPDNFNVANADVDTNIGITITDAVTIVNMVLTQQEPEPETE
jgi:hypothetical protein